jgi:hypothetical protein
MDNRIFNVNGSDSKYLQATLNLAFGHSWGYKCKAWAEDEKSGLILLWADADKDSGFKFPVAMSADEVFPLVNTWLRGEFAKKVLTNADGWDGNCDHDGHNSVGWRVYVGDWGHVNNSPYAICAIKPVYLWHGK